MLARLLSRFLARVSCQDRRLRVRIFPASVIDDFETGVLLLKRVIAKHQIKVAPIQCLDRFDRRDGSLNVISFLRQDEPIRREHRSLIVYHEDRSFMLGRHSNQTLLT